MKTTKRKVLENISLTLADTIRSFQKENYYGE